MGSPIIPADAASLHEEYFDPPTGRQNAHSSSSKAYTPLSTIDTTDPADTDHNHDNEQVSQGALPKSLTKPNHTHCKLCTERESKKAELFFARATCLTFAVALTLLCIMLGVVLARRSVRS